MHFLDSMIAFAAVILVAGLVVTAGTQFVISFLGLRGANLRRSLADLFETACDDRDAKRYRQVIARRVLCHPLISGSVFSRFGVRVDELPFVPADTAGKLRWAGNGIPFQPWLLGALSGFLVWPAVLAAITRLTTLDISAFASVVSAYAPFFNFYEHPWRTGAIAGAVLGGLLSRWRLATTVRADEVVAVLEKLSTPPGGSLPDPAQRAMLVIAGEALSGPRSKTNSTAAEYDKFVRELPENDPDELDMAAEKTPIPVSIPVAPRLEGVYPWFDHAMDRASQRFTLQARVITVVLSLILVLAAHLDAIRLFRMLSSDEPVRAQLAASADAMMKQGVQPSRTRDEAASRELVPDLYRRTMVEILQAAPIPEEPAKSKSRHSRHSATSAAQAAAGVSSAEPADGLVSASQLGEGAVVPQAVQLASETPARESRHRSSRSSKTKSVAPESQQPAVTPGEDRAMMETKARASRALETTPAFASREDAVAWLRGTLNSDPATENLVVNYEQAVDAQLVTDADKLLDQSASLKHDLARSELQLVSGKWQGLKPASGELPGLLIALALLSLGAPICYNLLKKVASLRPVTPAGTIVQADRRIAREDRRRPQTREQAKSPVRPQVRAPEKTDEDREPAASGHADRRL